MAAMMMGGLLACSSLGLAQNTNAPATNAPARGERRMTVQQRVDRMTTELKLTDEQKTKVTALFEAGEKKRQEMRADTSLTQEERREKGRSFMQEQNKKLKEILTPEQFEKWQKMGLQRRGRQAQGGAAQKKAAE